MHKVIYRGDVWTIKDKARSIQNGSPQWVLRRDRDGMPTIANAGECELYKPIGAQK